MGQVQVNIECGGDGRNGRLKDSPIHSTLTLDLSPSSFDLLEIVEAVMSNFNFCPRLMKYDFVTNFMTVF